MSLTDGVKLLHDYAERGDEAAFRELVTRYVDLVYSTAVRRLGGNADLARDVTQTVFSDLARKASSLRDVQMLGGWLHKHTGFIAAKAVRAARRRQAREREAAEMHALYNSPDLLWQQLAPVLDDAIDALGESDRQAIVLRFFDRRDFRSVGAMLGISDDAAQKRVSRALEKLRALLAGRGVTLGVPLLVSLMDGKLINASPFGLAPQVCKAALQGAMGTMDVVGILAKLASSTGFKSVLGIAVVSAVIGLVLFRPSIFFDGTSQSTHETLRTQETDARPLLAVSTTQESANEFAAASRATNESLIVKVISADSDLPIPGVMFDCMFDEGTNFWRDQLHATQEGICIVPVPRSTISRLLLRSRLDGYGDTWLYWQMERGDSIPDEYTLRLTRAVPMGGGVVDADGRPVGGAHVGFGAATMAIEDARPEMRVDGDFEARTDSQGRWTLNRVPPEVWRRLEGVAWHPEFVRSERVALARDPDAERHLLAATHVFRLGRAVVLTGTVLDPEGNPVPKARIQVSVARPAYDSGLGRSRAESVGGGDIRQITNHIDGSFVVTGCAPGSNSVSLRADGFVPTNFVVQLDSNSAPVSFTMQRGRRVRLQIMNQDGQPVAGAGVEFKHAMDADRHWVRTDTQGELEWNIAPGSDWTANVGATGYRSIENLPLLDSEEPQVVTLLRGLTLAGSIRDALNNQPIQHFRIISGWPDLHSNVTNIQWRSVDLVPWIRSQSGEFRQVIREAASARDSLVFKFEAEGYAPFVSREVKPDEGEVEFNIALRPAVSIIVTVLEPEGRLAAGTDIGLAYPGARLRLIPGGISRDPSSGGSRPLATDDRGQFTLPPDERIDRVIAAGARGYREVTRSELMSAPTIHLQPWGRIEGVFISRGRPAVNRVIQFQYGQRISARIGLLSAFTTLMSDYDAYQAETDHDGRFVFPQVPPGSHRLAQIITENRPTPLGVPQSGPRGQTVPLVDVDIRPGETETVTIGLSNHLVTVRIRWPSTLQRQPEWRISAIMQKPMPVPPVEIRNDREAMAAWRATPEIQADIAGFRRYQFTENPENVFTAEDVVPGNYTLSIVADDARAAGGTDVARARAAVTIPSGAMGGELDLGEFELERAL